MDDRMHFSDESLKEMFADFVDSLRVDGDGDGADHGSVDEPAASDALLARRRR